MKIDLWKCNKCSTEYRKYGGATVQFLVGYTRDANSSGSVSDYKHADLCTTCQNALLHHLIGKLEMVERVKVAGIYNAE